VENLRLVFTKEPDQAPVGFAATTKSLGRDDGRTLATQFPVRGRDSLGVMCEFQRRPGVCFEEGIYELELQARLNQRQKWKRLCRFPLRVTAAGAPIIRERFIAHDNDID
jgi:hypothetical protein